MNPYEGRPERAYWRSGVACHKGDIPDLYTKRFEISKSASVATAGSCFAQHITRHLRKQGWSVLDAEPGPSCLKNGAAQFGYGLYSARYGNIYTARQLSQLAREATGRWTPADAVWERAGRYFDALRPNVEPEGLDSPEEVQAHRRDHLTRVRDLIEQADVWVFTLGLTEAWTHIASGTVYPTAPGVIAGSFDSAVHRLKNFNVYEVVADFEEFRASVHAANPRARFLLTVSPVPLTATATDQHVLPATVLSKAILRAAAGMIYDRHEDCDYFPSFELIGSPFTGAVWFEKNMRSVKTAGVEMVMRHFFAEHDPGHGSLRGGGHEVKTRRSNETEEDDAVCEEALLDAFAR